MFLPTMLVAALGLSGVPRDTLRLVPPAAPDEPWLAVTTVPAGELVGKPGAGLSFQIDRLAVVGGRGVSLKVYVNTVRATADTPETDHHFVQRGYLFPAGEPDYGFVMDAGPALAKLAEAGRLRLDRPLVFALVLAPEFPDRPFGFKDWSVGGVKVLAVAKSQNGVAGARSRP